MHIDSKTYKTHKPQYCITHKIQKIGFIMGILVLLLFITFKSAINKTLYALEIDGNNYTIFTEEDFKDAIQDINGRTSGEYTIILGSDIIVNNSVTLNCPGSSVTIHGENHTLSLVKAYINVKGNSVLNLGNSDYNKTLAIVDMPPQTGNACTPLITANNNAKLNMYAGITISGRNGVDTAGGVQIENSTFNMHGGEISNCKSDSIAGGVLAYNSQFKMTGGTIKNCKSSNSGGGVFVLGNSTCEINGGKIEGCNALRSGGGVYVDNSQFKMNSGTIQDCNSVNYGGGVYTNSKFELSGGTISGCTNSSYGGAGVCVRTPNGTDIVGFEMSGGKIINCTSTSNINYGLGGGLLIINGLANIKEGSEIYNNHASRAGDDIFSFGTNAKLKLSDVPEGLILTETNCPIDGWYADGVVNGEDTARWNKDNFAQKYIPSPEEIIGTQIALKAAHGATTYNYYNYTIKYYIDGTLDDELTQSGTSDTVHVDNISTPDNCKIDSTDYVNVVEPTSETPGSFEVLVYCSKSVSPVTELRDSAPLNEDIINIIVQDFYNQLYEGMRLEIIPIEQGNDRRTELLNQLGDKYPIGQIALFDVNIYDKDGNKMSTFERKLRVLLQIPAGWNKENLEIIRFGPESDEKLEKNIVTIDGVDYVEFWTEHFSPYALIDKSTDKEQNPQNSEKSNNLETDDPTNIPILLSILIFSSLGVLWLSRKTYINKNKA